MSPSLRGKRQLCSAVPHVTRGQARVTRGQAQELTEAGNGDTDSGGKKILIKVCYSANLNSSWARSL